MSIEHAASCALRLGGSASFMLHVECMCKIHGVGLFAALRFRYMLRAVRNTLWLCVLPSAVHNMRALVDDKYV
jgi:hypothetical protein